LEKKGGGMMALPIDEYPIWFTNLEDFIADLTWGGKDKKIMMKEVLPKLINTFEVYKDVIETIDFSVKDSSEIDLIINEVLSKFPDKVEEYKKGKYGLINMFFGEVMKASRGKINAKEARQSLENKLTC
jgi:aspartyl-tRNA(Asn)/glutamyl-tRNA(Gln) amidotransferase subunit B